MRNLLKGRERQLAWVGGAVVPAGMILFLFLAPLWGWQSTLVLLKILTALFAVVAALWYLADDRPGDHMQSQSAATAGEASKREEESSGRLPEPLVEPYEWSDVQGGQYRRGHGKRREYEPSTYVFQGSAGSNEGLRERGLPKESKLPRDARLLKEYDGWALYTSPSEQSLYVRTTDYHPKPLRLTEEMLAGLLDELRAPAKTD